MDVIFNYIDNSHVVIQGALGSAFFWLILVFGQRLFNLIGSKISFLSAEYKTEYLYIEYIQKKLFRGSNSHEMISVCTYQALSYLLRGLVFLGLGFILSNLIPLSSSIGGIGFLFYLFRALGWLKPFYVGEKEAELDRWNRIEEIEKQLFGLVKDDTKQKLSELTKP